VKLKTALELIEGEWCTRAECEGEEWCRHEAELVARRAREEAFEMAAAELRTMKDNRNYVSRVLLDIAAEHIRALPTEPK